MVDDKDLAGLDPYELMATEAARLGRFFTSIDDDAWQKPTRCDQWSVRDLLAHLASTEGYNRACLDGTVQQFLAVGAEKGATDLATFNDLGIREYDERSTAEILAEWQATNTQNLKDFRARDGGDVDTTVGDYPARWQAFHLAFELATHADDVGAPVAPAEAKARVAWQAQFGRFALKESKPELRARDCGDGRTCVEGDAIDVELDNEEFVQALAARLPPGSEIDDKVAAALSVTP